MRNPRWTGAARARRPTSGKHGRSQLFARGPSWRGTQARRIDNVTIAPPLLALVLVTAAWLWDAPRWFPLDDAYIHLAYGKSLALSAVSA